MKYATTDIHGCFDEFMELLKKINFSDEDTMYILGDNVDRGPDPLKMVQYIYEHDNIISLFGNHEDFLIYGMSTDKKDELWTCPENGGDITYAQFTALRKRDPELYDKLIEDINNYPICLIVDNYILTHSGYDGVRLKNLPSTIESLNRMKVDDFLWSREVFFKNKGIDGYITLFGHTPTANIRTKFCQPYSDDVWYDERFGDKIGLDGGISFGGQLNCICLDTQEIFSVTWEDVE